MRKSSFFNKISFKQTDLLDFNQPLVHWTVCCVWGRRNAYPVCVQLIWEKPAIFKWQGNEIKYSKVCTSISDIWFCNSINFAFEFICTISVFFFFWSIGGWLHIAQMFTVDLQCLSNNDYVDFDRLQACQQASKLHSRQRPIGHIFSCGRGCCGGCFCCQILNFVR